MNSSFKQSEKGTSAKKSVNFSHLGLDKEDDLDMLKESSDFNTISTASSESIIKNHEIYDETNYIPNT